jgi:hypothetical protein
MKPRCTVLRWLSTLALCGMGALAVGAPFALPLLAQSAEPPVVAILGAPDSQTNPPNAHVFVSVVDRPTGATIGGLQDANFEIRISGETVAPSVTLDTTGLAVVMVIDRGGIARRNDPRIGSAVELAGAMLDLLRVDGSPTADLVALVGIRGEQSGGLTPLVPFTDFDPVAIRNTFDVLLNEVVDETTPLYEGIDRAISWIANNPDPTIQDKLVNRRKVILVFSDGIDRGFSDESHEALIVSQAKQHDILIYAVQMTAAGRTGESDSLNAMAVQSGGTFFVHTSDASGVASQEVVARFEDIATQRQAYRVTFPVVRPQGDYQLQVRVLDTPGGAATDATTISSRLQRPSLSLRPPAETLITVPYSDDLGAFEPTSLLLGAQLDIRDGAPRELDEVSYFANEQRIGVATSAPDYAITWDVTSLASPSSEPVTRTYTLVARAVDPFLGDPLQSDLIDVQVVWEPRVEAPRTVTEEVAESVVANWWILPIVAVLGLGLLVVVVLIVITRKQVARKVVQSQAPPAPVKGATQLLGAGGAVPAASAKLVVVQGPRMGSEIRLAGKPIKVGRDAQFNDFALNDPFVSNPHFSVGEEAGRFYIQDEGSTNRTRLNGAVLPPNQRQPLAPEAMIEVGQTRLQLLRLGGATRMLSGGAPGQGGQGETRRAGPLPPSQPSASPSGRQGGASDGQAPTVLSLPKRPNNR